MRLLHCPICHFLHTLPVTQRTIHCFCGAQITILTQPYTYTSSGTTMTIPDSEVKTPGRTAVPQLFTEAFTEEEVTP